MGTAWLIEAGNYVPDVMVW